MAFASRTSGTRSLRNERVRPVPTGKVKWYSAEKGFGFVSPEGGGRDVFVHATALERSGIPPLTEGQAVVMQVVQGKKGPEASTLTRA